MTASEPRSLTASLARLARLAEARGEQPDAELEEASRRIEDDWSARIPARFRNARLDDVEDPARGMLADWVLDSTANLVLLGPTGTGKTHAAVAALRCCHIRGLTVAFVSVVEMLDQLRPGGSQDDALQRLLNVRVLLLDDVGIEKTSEWTAERLYAIVNRRWLNKLPTIVTTNVPVRELERAIEPRLYSRLVHDALAVHVGGNDRRRTK